MLAKPLDGLIMTNNKPHLLVVSPCGEGVAGVGYLVSCLSLQRAFINKGWGINFSFKSGPLLHRMRNEFALEVINSNKYTHVLMVDSDIQFLADSVIKMLDLNKEVVAGVVPQKEYKEKKLIYNAKARKDCVLQEDNSVELSRVGTAFLLIEKEVFNKLKPFSKKVRYKSSSQESQQIWQDETIEVWNFFDFPLDDDLVEIGEDISFCLKCEKAGVPIYTLPTENFVHWGVHAYMGNTMDFFVD